MGDELSWVQPNTGCRAQHAIKLETSVRTIDDGGHMVDESLLERPQPHADLDLQQSKMSRWFLSSSESQGSGTYVGAHRRSQAT